MFRFGAVPSGEVSLAAKIYGRVYDLVVLNPMISISVTGLAALSCRERFHKNFSTYIAQSKSKLYSSATNQGSN
ncbi:hypothetical protein Y032_0523g2914 [Ancylostoma ceylanicum]|uniref:Uncharacterized protein n=1 Tax=Ancylostoma ceylanicum TaxID=53326 RepID=A0A016WUE1_9BILA|nr:hypothetical protein Y032_0523g2914 [Ancylostoma ceylanicum]